MRKIHLHILPKPVCGTHGRDAYSRDVTIVTCKNCLRSYAKLARKYQHLVANQGA